MKANRRPAWLVGLMGCCVAAAMAGLGCPNQRLEPPTLHVPADVLVEIATAEQPADVAEPRSPDEPYPVNHASPMSVVTGFLVALRQQDAETALSLLTRRGSLYGHVQALAEADPESMGWRWSELRCRIYEHVGVGPETNRSDRYCDVFTRPVSDQGYYVRFVLHGRNGEAWRIASFEPEYNEWATRSSQRLADEQWHPLPEVKAAQDLPPTHDLAARLLGGLANLQQVMPSATTYRAMLPASEQQQLTAERVNAWQDGLRAHLVLLRQHTARGARLAGCYEERRYRVADTGTDTARVVLRLCFVEDTDQTWSMRVVFGSLDSQWHLLGLEGVAEKLEWPDGARARMEGYFASRPRGD